MKLIRALLLPALLMLAWAGGSGEVAAQTIVHTSCGALSTVFPAASRGVPFSIDENGNTCINGAITASLAGFTPNGNYAALTAAGTSGSVALPSGATVLFQNTGTTQVSCTLGIGSATAVVNEIQVPASSTVPVVVGSNTFGACIDQSGSVSNTVVLAGGSGLGNGFGGGGGAGGGGGGAITAAANAFAAGSLSIGAGVDGWNITEGATTDAAVAAGAAGSMSAKLRLMTTQLNTVNTTLGTPFQAGGSIGNTTFAATQATSSNLKAQVDPLTAASWGIGTSTQNSASVANGHLVLGQFNTTPTTITSTNMSPLQLDNVGNLLVNIKAGASSGAVAQGSTTSGQTGGLTQAAVTTAAPTYTTAQTSPLSLTTAGELRTFDSQVLAAAQAATPAGTNIIGKVGIDQTTPGTTNGVQVNAALPAGTNVIGALTANQSVNVAQFGGVSTATGQVAVSVAPVTATNTALVTALRPDSPGIVALGQTTKSASVPVAIASDQVGTAGTAAANVLTVQGISSMTKLLVTPDSVALPANQSVNVAQVNGVATLTGTGVAGTGTQRVTLSNTDPCASPDIAKSSAIINITSAATTALVAVSGATVTYVCGFTFSVSQVVTTPNTLVFEQGTGTACATSPVALTGLYGGGGVTAAAPIVVSSQADRTIFKTAASNGLCALTAIGGSGSFQGVLTYVQQ